MKWTINCGLILYPKEKNQYFFSNRFFKVEKNTSSKNSIKHLDMILTNKEISFYLVFELETGNERKHSQMWFYSESVSSGCNNVSVKIIVFNYLLWNIWLSTWAFRRGKRHIFHRALPSCIQGREENVPSLTNGHDRDRRRNARGDQMPW